MTTLRLLPSLVLSCILLVGACSSSDVDEDARACEMLRDAGGEDVAIYDDLSELDLSSEMQADLDAMEAAGEELSEELMTAASRVDARCADLGVELS